MYVQHTQFKCFLLGPAAIFRADCWIRPTETRPNVKGSVQLWQL